MIIGSSSLILRCKEVIKNAGPMRLLLVGETGVGKTPFAKYSNEVLTKRLKQKRPFEQINCACLKHERFVDELFGHIKGAYTGAITNKQGLVEKAENGDLFLDEIGDLDLECQAELLTYLDNYEYYKLGGIVKHSTKVRIIAATNKDLQKMIAEGKFRKDLYSRLAQCVVVLPPLRDRREDIPALIRYFVYSYCGKEKKVRDDIIEHFQCLDWLDGNVRGLKNICEYMCVCAQRSNEITWEHLPEELTKDINKVWKPKFSLFVKDVYKLGYEQYMRNLESYLLQELLKKSNTITSLASKIKMNRMTLNRKLSRLSLK